MNAKIARIRKRIASEDTFIPSQASIVLWEPFIQHIQNIHQDFPMILCLRFSRILVQRFCSTPDAASNKSDLSYDEYLARWINWMIEATRQQLPELRKEVVVFLIQLMGCEIPSTTAPQTLSVFPNRHNITSTTLMMAQIFASLRCPFSGDG